MNYDFLSVSNGSGDAALMQVTADRTAGSTTIAVNTVSNVPTKFIGTYGTLGSNGLITPATKRDFRGHVSGSTLIIDAFEPGSSDAGNTAGQLVVIKPNTGWGNRVATFIKNATGNGTPEALTVSALTVAGRDVADFVPSGIMAPYAGSTAPSGWLLCDGSAVSRSTYANLFTAIGTTYGAGNGTTTFNLPSTLGRVITGYDASQTEFNAIGKTGGEKTHLLTTAEMPVHSHGVNDPGHAHTIKANAAYPVAFGGGGPPYPDTNPSGNPTSTNATGISIQNAGSGGAHNILQPYIAIKHIIKT